MRRLAAFARGMAEFRSVWTTHYGPDLIETYDAGREFAHRLTRRRHEP